MHDGPIDLDAPRSRKPEYPVVAARRGTVLEDRTTGVVGALVSFAPPRLVLRDRYGKDHTAEALMVLGFIATLMITESLFDATLVAAQAQGGQPAAFVAPLTLVWLFTALVSNASAGTLQALQLKNSLVLAAEI